MFYLLLVMPFGTHASAAVFLYVEPARHQLDRPTEGHVQDGTRFKYKAWEHGTSDADGTWIKIGIPLVIIASLYVLMIAINLFSNAGVSHYHARDAFYPLIYHLDLPNSKKQKAYLRYLSSKKALILSNEELPRGAPLIVKLGSLPGFPDEHQEVPARVIREPKKISKFSNRYNIWVKFENRNGAHHQAIENYLETSNPHRSKIIG